MVENIEYLAGQASKGAEKSFASLCNISALDYAVSRGIFKAKNSRLDSKKFIQLGAACVFVFAMFFTVNLNLFETLAETYYRNWHYIMPETAEALDGYINDLIINAKKHFGVIMNR